MKSPARSAAALVETADRAYRGGDLTLARRLVVEATAAEPADAAAWLLRADLARAAGDVDALHVDLGRAVALASDPRLRPLLELDRAWALFRAGWTGHAQDSARKLGDVVPARLGVWAALLDAVGLPEEADVVVRRWLEHDRSNPAAWLSLASVSIWLGRSETAVEACRQALTLAPDFAPAYSVLAGGRRWRTPDEDLARMQRALPRAQGSIERAHIGYALFKAYDDLGEVEAAWTALQGAAEAARSAQPSRPPAATQAWAQSPALQGRPQETSGPRPIFIVGLPRSGTTLVDRVLGAHSAVRSLGELTTFGLLARTSAAQAYLPYGGLVVEVRRRRDWSEVGAAYRTEVARLAGDAQVVTDKNLQNWLLAEGIAEALPEALFVHVRRDPMDSLFGAYKQLFAGGEYPWSYELTTLADHFQDFAGATVALARRLGARWIEVSYEALVRRPESAIPALLKACGLGVEETCLNPADDPAPVRTLSALQVRQPITDRSIGAWKRYGTKLEPLRKRLEAASLL